jgi:hypothetical protein
LTAIQPQKAQLTKRAPQLKKQPQTNKNFPDLQDLKTLAACGGFLFWVGQVLLVPL